MVRTLAFRSAALAVLLSVATAGAPAFADTTARLKDVVSLQGPESLPLMGYGLIVGLNKTGDRRQTIFSTQSLANILQQMGVSVRPGEVKVENIAAVLVTANLPVYARPGVRLDVTASSIGDARSLQGGTLLATALRGPNGQVYALAQGPLSIGGFGGGSGGNSVQVNHLTVGRVPNGGLVQQASGIAMPVTDVLPLSLHDPDFATATRVAASINGDLGEGSAKVLDPGTVVVAVPSQYKASLPELMARLEALTVTADTPARVVINERSGTIVVGANVRIAAAAVAHGNLSVKISTKFEVSQPNALARTGDTVVVPNQQVDVREGTARLVSLEEGTTLDSVVRALNALGATPRDIIAIMQALKAAGALSAEIVII
ncbi:MAG: flagellar basal body P-ring protein FlgI [Vicinamibacterales bacterium]